MAYAGAKPSVDPTDLRLSSAKTSLYLLVSSGADPLE